MEKRKFIKHRGWDAHEFSVNEKFTSFTSYFCVVHAHITVSK